MRFPRSSWWFRTAQVFIVSGGALLLALLPGVWALFSLAAIAVLATIFYLREGARAMLWRKALLPTLFLVGSASFMHFTLLPVWVVYILIAVVAWLCYELYWKTLPYEEEALVYISAFLLGLAVWDFSVRDILPFWIDLLLYVIFMLGLASFRLSLFGEPLKLSLIFGVFVALNSAEIFFILGFWPIGVVIKAVLCLLGFYIQLSLLLAAESGTVSIRKVLVPILITLVLALALFLTTQWYPFV